MMARETDPTLYAYLFVLAILLICAGTVGGQTCTAIVPEASGGTTTATSMKFIDTNGALGANLSTAVDSWNDTCSGEDIPSLMTTGTANISVNIFALTGNRPQDPSGDDQGCGRETVMYNSTGGVVSAFIEVWEDQSNGTSCSGGLTAVLSHEIGHVLGLDHVDGSSCSGSLMFSETLDPDAEPSDENCNSLNTLWKTPFDPPPQEGDHPCRGQVV